MNRVKKIMASAYEQFSANLTSGVHHLNMLTTLMSRWTSEREIASGKGLLYVLLREVTRSSLGAYLYIANSVMKEWSMIG